jgi:hypothetical protein
MDRVAGWKRGTAVHPTIAFYAPGRVAKLDFVKESGTGSVARGSEADEKWDVGAYVRRSAAVQAQLTEFGMTSSVALDALAPTAYSTMDGTTLGRHGELGYTVQQRVGDGEDRVRVSTVSDEHGPVDSALSMRAGSDDTAWAEFCIGKHFVRFQTKVGINSIVSNMAGAVIFRVICDGEERHHRLIGDGDRNEGWTAEFDVDVSGVEVLRLETQVIGSKDRCQGVWLRPVLLPSSALTSMELFPTDVDACFQRGQGGSPMSPEGSTGDGRAQKVMQAWASWGQDVSRMRAALGKHRVHSLQGVTASARRVLIALPFEFHLSSSYLRHLVDAVSGHATALCAAAPTTPVLAEHLLVALHDLRRWWLAVAEQGMRGEAILGKSAASISRHICQICLHLVGVPFEGGSMFESCTALQLDRLLLNDRSWVGELAVLVLDAGL